MAVRSAAPANEKPIRDTRTTDFLAKLNVNTNVFPRMLCDLETKSLVVSVSFVELYNNPQTAFGEATSDIEGR